MKTNKASENIIVKFTSEIFVFLILFFLFSFKLALSYHFDSDFGRDLMWMHDIAHGKITLLGPKLSFGGYYLGPYYYYLFVPFLSLTKFFPSGVLLGNAFLFALTNTIIFYLVKKNFGLLKALFAISIITLSPFYLFSARSPGNAFSYLHFLFLLIFSILIYPSVIKKPALSFLTGLLTGIILNFHPVTLLYLAPLIGLSLYTQKLSRKSLIPLILGIALSFSPTILFELRHNFSMFRNTFIYKSYKTFTQGNSPASIVHPSKNPFVNFFLINKLSKGFLTPNLLAVFFLNLILFLTGKKTRAIKISFFSFISTLILFSLLLRFQVAIHYLFPLYTAALASLIFLLLNLKNKIFYIFINIGLLLLLAVNFPKHLYKPASRTFQSLWRDTKLLKEKLPKEGFNVVVIRETPLAILGYEYRYILRLLGYKSDDEFSYKRSKYLLVVSEKGEININDYKSWELSEFGKKRLIKKIKGKRLIFYVFVKSN